MNEFVQGAIDTRRRMLLDTYFIDDPAFARQIKDVFDVMTELGMSCPDVATFESEFTDSILYARYYDLCTQAASRFQVRQVDTQIPNAAPTPGEIVRDVADWGGAALDSATQPTRHAVYEERRQVLEDTPVIGDLLQASRTASVFRKWFTK